MLANREAGSSAGMGTTPHRPAGGLPSGLVDWQRRRCRTFAWFAAANAAMWFLAHSRLRAYCLIGILLLLKVLTTAVKGVKGDGVPRRLSASWEMMDRPDPDPDSGSQLHLSGALRLFLQETSAFRQQNPGKFCLLVCSFCTFFAVLGRYIPGIVISYFVVLSVFLWPVLSSAEASLRLKPVLQKLDFGVAALVQKIKEDHERRILKARLEKESVESDLSSMFPKLDSAACKELSVSDTSVSDVTWTDNLNLSEENTPQTENSEDLDRELLFSGGLHNFPSVDNGATTNGEDDDEDDFDLSRPIGSERAAPPPDAILDLVQNTVSAAVAAAIQERVETAVGLRLPKPAEESDSEADDFELLDQAELDQLGAELELPGGDGVKTTGEEHGNKPPGFFAKLLRRH
ncbi:reticulophagy regulator 1 [Vanacampus margaritifer]